MFEILSQFIVNKKKKKKGKTKGFEKRLGK
jgi:hypothetical protein